MRTGFKPSISLPVEENTDILLQEVSVMYRVPRERMSGLKEYTIRWLQRKVQFEEFWALRGVSIAVRHGEVFGVIGRNGSGKSTLLKVVARVLAPTRGRVFIRGQVAPLLELGGGFHQELTGRENIYLNSALLGRSRAETDRMFGEIVDFAEIGEFIDAPIRTYSTGMVARLGFAVATCSRPHILLVDEVLSVGDASFQQKCMDRMDTFRKQGTTILIVTHSMGTIDTFCDRALWLDYGHPAAAGEVNEVIQRYINLGNPELSTEMEAPPDPAQIARNILDFHPLGETGAVLSTDGIFDPSQGTVSTWLKFKSNCPHRDAVIFHTDDSRYILYVGSYYSKSRQEAVPVLIGRAGGNRRVMDTFYGAPGFPEAASPVAFSEGQEGVTFPKDEWHLLAMTWKGYPRGSVKLYMDDRPISVKAYDSRFDNGRPMAANLAVGIRPTTWPGEFIEKEDGKLVESPVIESLSIDDSELEIKGTRLYAKALGPEEIKALCALGRLGE